VPELAKGLVLRLSSSLGLNQRTLGSDAVQWLKSQAATGRFDAEGGNVRGLRNLLEQALVFNPEVAHLKLQHLLAVEEQAACSFNADDVEPVFRESVAPIAEFIGSLDKTTLRWVEDRFRAELFKALRTRMSREEMRNKFEMTAAALRQQLKSLRDKGLIPPEL
jgi:DNA-binding NtrC family response regulator